MCPLFRGSTVYCYGSQEKTRALEEGEKHKKELELATKKLTKVTSDLRRAEEEKMSLAQQLQQIENHRDLLLDKVRGQHPEGAKYSREGGQNALCTCTCTVCT